MNFKVFCIFLTIFHGDFCSVPIVAGRLTCDVIVYETFNVTSNLIVGDLGHKRISRGVFGVTANLTLKEDLYYDSGIFVEQNLYTAPYASTQYQKLPHLAALGRITFKDFMIFYHDRIMRWVSECSNLPQFEGEFIPPAKAGNYYANNCQMHDDNIPSYILPAFYKYELLFTKDGASFGVRSIFQILNQV